MGISAVPTSLLKNSVPEDDMITVMIVDMWVSANPPSSPLLRIISKMVSTKRSTTTYAPTQLENHQRHQ
jgi:hypothetical protein